MVGATVDDDVPMMALMMPNGGFTEVFDVESPHPQSAAKTANTHPVRVTPMNTADPIMTHTKHTPNGGLKK